MLPPPHLADSIQPISYSMVYREHFHFLIMILSFRWSLELPDLVAKGHMTDIIIMFTVHGPFK